MEIHELLNDNTPISFLFGDAKTNNEKVDKLFKYLTRPGVINVISSYAAYKFHSDNARLTFVSYIAKEIKNDLIEELVIPDSTTNKTIIQRIEEQDIKTIGDLNRFLYRILSGKASSAISRAKKFKHIPISYVPKYNLPENKYVKLLYDIDINKIISEIYKTEDMFDIYKTTPRTQLSDQFIEDLRQRAEIYSLLIDFYNAFAAKNNKYVLTPNKEILDFNIYRREPVFQKIIPIQNKRYIRKKPFIDISKKEEIITNYEQKINELMPHITNNLAIIAQPLYNFLFSNIPFGGKRFRASLNPNDPIDNEFAQYYIKALMTLQEEIWIDRYLSKIGSGVSGENFLRVVPDANQYIYNYLMKAIDIIKSKYPHIGQDKIKKYYTIAQYINQEHVVIDRETKLPKLNPDGSIKVDKPIHLLRMQLKYAPVLLAKAEAMQKAQEKFGKNTNITYEEAEKIADEILNNSIFFNDPHRRMLSFSINPKTGKPQNQNDLTFQIKPEYLKEYLIKLIMSDKEIPRIELEKLVLKRAKEILQSSHPEEVDEAENNENKSVESAIYINNILNKLLIYASLFDKAAMHKHASRIDNIIRRNSQWTIRQ